MWPSQTTEAQDTVYASLALDVDLSSGTLRPLRASKRVSDATGHALFVDGCCVLADRGQVSYAHNPVGCNRVFRAGVAGHVEFADVSEAPVWARLGVPAPTVAPAAESLLPLVDDSTVEDVQYVYTYQSGEREGPPSYPSSPVLCNYGAGRIITGLEWPDASVGVTQINIYQAVAGTKALDNNTPAAAGYRLVGTVFNGDTQFTHDGKFFGSLLETQLYADIPSDLSSLEFIESHSVLCGISTLRKMVAFSEPYLHHSFPIENYVRFGDTPRRVVANRTTTFVLTDGYPYLMPTAPGRAARTPVPIEQALPIIAPRSAAVFAHGVVYASTDGLVMITNSGRATVITNAWLNQQQWRAILPTAMVGAIYDGYYYGGTPEQAFRFRLNDDAFQLKADDQLIYLSMRPTAMYASRRDGLYYADATGTYRWGEGNTVLPFKWVSTNLRSNGVMAFNAARVHRSDHGELVITHIHDNRLVLRRKVGYSLPYRVGMKASARTHAVQLEGTAEVYADVIATSMRELDR